MNDFGGTSREVVISKSDFTTPVNNAIKISDIQQLDEILSQILSYVSVFKIFTKQFNST